MRQEVRPQGRRGRPERELKALFDTRVGAAAAILAAIAACSREGAPASNQVAAGNVASPTREAAVLLLDAEGLRVNGARLQFGAPEAAAIEAVARALGGPPSERGTNEECGAGKLEYAAWKDQLTLWSGEGRFAGWDSKGALKTAGGIGLGSRRGELAGLDGLQVTESSLGTEFSGGGLFGLLSSKTADAQVTAFWGGTTCVFR